MKKNIKKLSCLILLSCLLSSCEKENNYLFIYHTYSENEIKSVYVDEEDAELYQLPTPKKEGYTFEGWYLDEELSRRYTPDLIEDEHTVELFAKYKVNEYSINYHLSDNDIIENKYDYNQVIETFIPEKENYYFIGWYLDSNYQVSFDYYQMPSRELNVFAKWECVSKRETHLIFLGNHEEIIEPMLVEENELLNYKLPEPIKEGYTFNGWYLDKELTKKFEIDEKVLEKEVINLYSSFVVNEYTLEIYSGINETYSQKIDYGAKLNLPSDLEKIGYTFEGWYLDENYNKEFKYENMPSKNVKAYALWEEIPQYKVSISSNIEGAFSFEGEVNQLLNYENPNFIDVKINENIGYKFKYYEIDGVKYSSRTISIDKVNNDIDVVVYGEYATYELPIININTQGNSIDSKVDYTDMTFSISNCEDELNNIVGGIRLRGNSTKNLPKKPYRIKFDKKQSLFGLPKAKSWVLLADYLDPSNLHNYSAFKMAAELDGLSFTPSPFKVNVYLNGEYNGLYTLCEQVQENEGRMNIEEDITEEMKELKDFNFFICMDQSVVGDQDAVLDETYFYLEEYNKYFELKYPEKENFISEEQFNKFFNELKDYVKYIMSIFVNKDVDAIKKEVNVSSLVDYLIIDQIMGEMDHTYKSFNMYYTHSSENEKEKEKLSFGPIWDYDWSLYTPWTGKPNQSYVVTNKIEYSNCFFKAIATIPEFNEILKERWVNTASQVLEEYLSSLYKIEVEIKESLALNAGKWYCDYDENITQDNITFLNKFLINRKTLLDKTWGN